MESSNLEQLKSELKRDEGYSPSLYKCTSGYLTIGWGHNLESKDINKDLAEKMLDDDISSALLECEGLSYWEKLSDVRQRVIANMVFNMGLNGLLKFKNMNSALREDDYNRASEEMIDSLWYRQVGNRAKRLVKMMLLNVDMGN